MSGGIAYVYDPDGTFPALRQPRDGRRSSRSTTTTASGCAPPSSATASSPAPTVAERLLDDWESEVEAFRKVMPKDYKRVLAVMREAERARPVAGGDATSSVMESAHG